MKRRKAAAGVILVLGALLAIFIGFQIADFGSHPETPASVSFGAEPGQIASQSVQVTRMSDRTVTYTSDVNLNKSRQVRTTARIVPSSHEAYGNLRFGSDPPVKFYGNHDSGWRASTESASYVYSPDFRYPPASSVIDPNAIENAAGTVVSDNATMVVLQFTDSQQTAAAVHSRATFLDAGNRGTLTFYISKESGKLQKVEGWYEKGDRRSVFVIEYSYGPSPIERPERAPRFNPDALLWDVLH